MHWTVPLLLIGWGGFCVLFSFGIRHLPGVVKFLFTIIVILLFAGTGYLFTEYVSNKGPDDWGALWHAGYPLAARYGKSDESSYSGKGFEKDPDGSGSGTYVTRFRYAGHTGVVRSHYNVSTHKFDHDEIVSDH